MWSFHESQGIKHCEWLRQGGRYAHCVGWHKRELTSVAVPVIIQFHTYLSVTGPESELGPPLPQRARNEENALHRWIDRRWSRKPLCSQSFALWEAASGRAQVDSVASLCLAGVLAVSCQWLHSPVQAYLSGDGMLRWNFLLLSFIKAEITKCVYIDSMLYSSFI